MKLTQEQVSFDRKRYSIKLDAIAGANGGRVYLHQDTVVAQLVKQQGRISLVIQAQGMFRVEGNLYGDHVDILSEGHVTLDAKIRAKHHVVIHARQLRLAKAAQVNAKAVAIKGNVFILNQGKVAGGEVVFEAPKVTNYQQIRATKLRVSTGDRLVNYGLLRSRQYSEFSGQILINRGNIDCKHSCSLQFNSVRLEQGRVQAAVRYQVQASEYVDSALTIAPGFCMITAESISCNGEQQLNVATISAKQNITIHQDNTLFIAQALNLSGEGLLSLGGEIYVDNELDITSGKFAQKNPEISYPAGLQIAAGVVTYAARAQLGDMPINIVAKQSIDIKNQAWFGYSTEIGTNASIFLKAGEVTNLGKLNSKFVSVKANKLFCNRGELVAAFATVDASAFINSWQISASDQLNINSLIYANTGIITSSAQVTNAILTYNAGLQLFEVPTQFSSVFSKTKLALSAKLLASNVMPQLASLFNLMLSAFYLRAYYSPLKQQLSGVYQQMRKGGVSSIDFSELLPAIALLKDASLSVYGMKTLPYQVWADANNIRDLSVKLQRLTEKPTMMALEVAQLFAPKHCQDSLLSLNTGALATLNSFQRSIQDFDRGFKGAVELSLQADYIDQQGCWMAQNLMVISDGFDVSGIVVAGLNSGIYVRQLHLAPLGQLSLFDGMVMAEDASFAGYMRADRSQVAATSQLSIFSGADVKLDESMLRAKHFLHQGAIKVNKTVIAGGALQFKGEMIGNSAFVMGENIEFDGVVRLSDAFSVKGHNSVELSKASLLQVHQLMLDAAQLTTRGEMKVEDAAMLTGQSWYHYGNLYVKENLSAQFNRLIANLFMAKISARHLNMTSLVYFSLVSQLIGRSSLRQYAAVDASIAGLRRSYVLMPKSLISLPFGMDLPHVPDRWEDAMSWLSIVSGLRMAANFVSKPISPLVNIAFSGVDVAYMLYNNVNRLYDIYQTKGLSNIETKDVVPLLLDSIDIGMSVKKMWDNFQMPGEQMAQKSWWMKFQNVVDYQETMRESVHLLNNLRAATMALRDSSVIDAMARAQNIFAQSPRLKGFSKQMLTMAAPKITHFNLLRFGSNISVSGSVNERTLLGATLQYDYGMLGVSYESHQYAKYGAVASWGNVFFDITSFAEYGHIFASSGIMVRSQDLLKMAATTWRSSADLDVIAHHAKIAGELTAGAAKVIVDRLHFNGELVASGGQVFIQGSTADIGGLVQAGQFHASLQQVDFRGAVKAVNASIYSDKRFHNMGAFEVKQLVVDSDNVINDGRITATSMFHVVSKNFCNSRSGYIHSPKTSVSALYYSNSGVIWAYSFTNNSVLGLNAGLVLPCMPEKWSDVFNFENAYTVAKIGVGFFCPPAGFAMDLAQKAYYLPSQMKSLSNHVHYLINTNSGDFRVRHVLPGLFEVKNLAFSAIDTYACYNGMKQDVSYRTSINNGELYSLGKEALYVLGPTHISNHLLSVNAGVIVSGTVVNNSLIGANYGVTVGGRVVYYTGYGHNAGILSGNDVVFKGGHLRSDGLISNRESLYFDLSSLTVSKRGTLIGCGKVNGHISGDVDIAGRVTLQQNQGGARGMVKVGGKLTVNAKDNIVLSHVDLQSQSASIHSRVRVENQAVFDSKQTTIAAGGEMVVDATSIQSSDATEVHGVNHNAGQLGRAMRDENGYVIGLEKSEQYVATESSDVKFSGTVQTKQLDVATDVTLSSKAQFMTDQIRFANKGSLSLHENAKAVVLHASGKGDMRATGQSQLVMIMDQTEGELRLSEQAKAAISISNRKGDTQLLGESQLQVQSDNCTGKLSLADQSRAVIGRSDRAGEILVTQQSSAQITTDASKGDIRVSDNAQISVIESNRQGDMRASDSAVVAIKTDRSQGALVVKDQAKVAVVTSERKGDMDVSGASELHIFTDASTGDLSAADQATVRVATSTRVGDARVVGGAVLSINHDQGKGALVLDDNAKVVVGVSERVGETKASGHSVLSIKTDQTKGDLKLSGHAKANIDTSVRHGSTYASDESQLYIREDNGVGDLELHGKARAIVGTSTRRGYSMFGGEAHMEIDEDRGFGSMQINDKASVRIKQNHRTGEIHVTDQGRLAIQEDHSGSRIEVRKQAKAFIGEAHADGVLMAQDNSIVIVEKNNGHRSVQRSGEAVAMVDGEALHDFNAADFKPSISKSDREEFDKIINDKKPAPPPPPPKKKKKGLFHSPQTFFGGVADGIGKALGHLKDGVYTLGKHHVAGGKNVYKFITGEHKLNPKAIEKAWNKAGKDISETWQKAGGDISSEWKNLPPDMQKAIIVAAVIAIAYFGGCALISSGVDIVIAGGVETSAGTIFIEFIQITAAGVELFPAFAGIAGAGAAIQEYDRKMAESKEIERRLQENREMQRRMDREKQSQPPENQQSPTEVPEPEMPRLPNGSVEMPELPERSSGQSQIPAVPEVPEIEGDKTFDDLQDLGLNELLTEMARNDSQYEFPREETHENTFMNTALELYDITALALATVPHPLPKGIAGAMALYKTLAFSDDIGKKQTAFDSSAYQAGSAAVDHLLQFTPTPYAYLLEYVKSHGEYLANKMASGANQDAGQKLSIEQAKEIVRQQRKYFELQARMERQQNRDREQEYRDSIGKTPAQIIKEKLDEMSKNSGPTIQMPGPGAH